ncbi:porin [Zunongwangia sp. HRR-M8]|uniref:porin n=1 Tax=Zunongwangia sp. HRR-M8 TaxID=3015170 RepID=UPI0022DDFADF|nr:porin [Zunongwangia sp. HRR-M8]WBL21626.1 porin [Zunongwangia sp. HRR-M8]
MKQKLPLKNYCIALLILCFLPLQESNAQEKSDEKPKPKLDIGGALRFNYNLSSWKPEMKERGGDFGFDLFRLAVQGEYKNLYINAEYRFYSEAFGGNFLKQGWLGYHLNDEQEIQIGLLQVPFGIERYNSHNWFLNLPYYVGLEDDYDMGVRYSYKGDMFEYYAAFFKNGEELTFGNNSAASSSRYSYDIVGKNKEVNQINGKIVYKPNLDGMHKIGLSAQYGGIYNIETQETGDRYALAVHYEFRTEDWFIKAQATKAEFNPENAPGNSRDIIQMGAYGTPYEVATNFEIYNFGISRLINIDRDFVEKIEIYNDFGYMHKSIDGFAESYMNVFGVLINSGPISTYIDYAAGYNHSWLGGDFDNEFSTGDPGVKWEARFNINVGYYF